ncbi:MAG: NAD(P)H-dependent oxidoreductase subunit E [Actinobacteria bacterium]|nr:NAD(P)H-dependent oxidoreductase subunit E [Actinomycetota bacterium]
MTAWPPELEGRAQALAGRYPERRSAVGPLLYLAMKHDGGLTAAGVRRVAELTGLTPAQVQGVASFYTMYQEAPGRYLISVCTSISCHLLGGEAVLAAVEEETGVAGGETDGERLFTVEHVECLGACGGAPALQVNYETVEGVTPEAAQRLCRRLREQRPAVIRSDALQEEFGGRPAFDWGPGEAAGAVAPVPAFEPYGTAEAGP